MRLQITLTLDSTSQLEGLESALEVFTEFERDRRSDPGWTQRDQRRYEGAMAVREMIDASRDGKW